MLKYLLLIITVFSFCSTDLKASHMVGGQITWECLPNGQYVFKMEVYRECTGTWFHFGKQSLSYQNGSIVLRPDSNRWLSYGGNGNISAIGLNGCQRNCGPRAQMGATQIFPYVSDTITLNGTPPLGGWLFTWTLCCRPFVANIQNPYDKYFTLRARMYPYKGRNANQCYDSSPKFHELPAVLFCKGNEYIYNHNPVDEDLDSLVFSWAEPWHEINIPVVFASGYSYNSPLPDTTFHPLNIPASLNEQTGEIHFRTYSGQSGHQYATTVRVDSYREGVKIASVYRDIPFIAFDCPPNDPPIATFDNVQSRNFVDTVMAGEFVSIPIQLVDTNIDSTTMLPQEVAVAPRGYLFSNNLIDSLDCMDSTLAPCATVSPSPIFDSLTGEIILKAQGTINASFEWQTDCVHLGPDTGKVSKYKTYNFIFKTFDAACDVPATIYPSMSIVVERFQPNIQQNGNILSVDTAESYQWFYNGNPIPNSDTNQIFVISYGRYSVEVVKNGCVSQKANYQFMSVSLNDKTLKNGLKVYPNPFKDGFVVELNDFANKDISINMLDLNGKEVSIQPIFEKGKCMINNTGSLTPGIYFIKVSTAEAEVYKKVIKL